MKKFITRVLLFVVLLILIDRFFILFRPNETNLFNEIAREKSKKVANMADKFTELDAIIVGSSHAQFGISPEIINKKLGIKTINLAYGGGANMGAQLTMLNRLLNEKKTRPRYMFFGIDVFALNNEPSEKEECLSILFKEKENLYEFFKSKLFISYFKAYARYIPKYYNNAKKGDYLLPYLDPNNSYDLSMFDGFKKYEITRLGWVKGYGYPNKSYVRYSGTTFKPDLKAVKCLKDYIHICKKYNIDIVLIQIPEHKVCLNHHQKYTDFSRWLSAFVDENGIKYLDFNDESVFPVDNDSLFFDTDHLNAEGAQQFTFLLCEMLKRNAIILKL